MATPKVSRTKAFEVYIAATQEEERTRATTEGKELSVADLKEICAQKWRALSDLEKKRYYDMAAEEEEKEAEENKDEKPAKKGKKEKDPNAPKKNLSSYIHFSKIQRPQLLADNPGIKATEVVKEIAKLWNELDDDEKAVYVKIAADDKKRYEAELKKK